MEDQGVLVMDDVQAFSQVQRTGRCGRNHSVMLMYIQRRIGSVYNAVSNFTVPGPSDSCHA